eukprot:UN28089
MSIDLYVLTINDYKHYYHLIDMHLGDVQKDHFKLYICQVINDFFKQAFPENIYRKTHYTKVKHQDRVKMVKLFYLAYELNLDLPKNIWKLFFS